MKVFTKLSSILLCLFVTYGIAQGQTFNETQGTNSGTSLTSGDYNVLYGDSTGARLTQGSGQVLIGTAAGSKLTNQAATDVPHAFPASSFSKPNVFIGHAAGYNSTSWDNVFIGPYAGWSATTGGDNVYIGAMTGSQNVTGHDNVYIGYRAGYTTTEARKSVFVGNEAGYDVTTGDYNTLVGNASGHSITTGFRNACFGNDAGYDMSTGYYNTCIGDSAGVDMSISIGNTMIGHASGAATEWANYNTFVGHNAGWDNNRTNNNNGFNATGNTYQGAYAGFSNRDGAYNLVMGAFADFEITGGIGGNAAATQNLYNVALGSYSEIGAGASRTVSVGPWARSAANQTVAIGDSARSTGAKSVVIGSRSVATGTNSIAIGADLNVAASNKVVVGNSLVTSIGGVVNWTATSDQRFKSNIEENVIGLEFIKNLRPVTYNMDPQAIENHFGREIPEELKASADEKAKVRYTGFLAQEVEWAADASGYDFSGIDTPTEGNDAYGIRYAEFVVPLVKAIQEQQEIIEGQTQEIQAYQSALEHLTNKVNQMEVQLMEVAPIQQVSYSK